MANITANTAAKDTVSTKLAIIILLLSFLAFVIIGLAIGYFFFWGNGLAVSKLDIDYGRGVAQTRQNPEDPQAHIDLGWVYLQQKKYTLAEREYEEALALDKNNVSALYNLALLKVQTGDVGEARTALEKAKKHRPGYVKARATLGFVYAEQGQLDKALAEYSFVEKYYPGNSDLMYQIGQVYEKKGQTQKALEHYNQALAYNPKMEKAKKAIDKLK